MRTATAISLVLSIAACRSDKDPFAEEEEFQVVITDADGDGFGIEDDCNDQDSTIHPEALEVCDGIDNNCDEEVDENTLSTFYTDADDDGFGTVDQPVEACTPPSGTVAIGTDCDDEDDGSYPGASERCDGVDNDCDGEVDEDVLDAWYADADDDGYGDPDSALDSCDPPSGYVSDDRDCDDSTEAAYPGATEICDEIDNDCDDVVDEGVTTTWYADTDGDGYGLSSMTEDACTEPTGYSTVPGDCDDESDAIHPGATEVCNELDDDCDGTIDEDDAFDATTWYLDADSDGYGLSDSTTRSCSMPSGYAAVDDDCNDSESEVNPAATEFCDEIDNDCDGTVDEDDAADAITWYGDADGDGYGGATFSLMQCDQPSNYADNSSDCDDGDDAVFPGAEEVCDEIDNDCDGDIDGGLTIETWYADLDGDGYGDSSDSIEDCEAPSSYVEDDTDCDDDADDVNPGASEICDGLDNDCDGDADEGLLGTDSICPAEDCTEVLDSDSTATDGNYYLDAGTYYCDMTTDGGGWTLVGDTVAVWGTSYDTSYYNSEGFTWNESLFLYNSGTAHAHCTYPDAMTGCNNIGFQFGSESWGLPLNWGASLCSLSTTDYTSNTSYIGGYDFVIDRTDSTDSIRLGTLEGIAGCTTGDNPGTAYVDVYVRR